MKSFDDDQIVCSRHLHSPTVYRRGDVLEVIARKWGESTLSKVMFRTLLTGGVVTGAYYLAAFGPWGIAVGVTVGLLLWYGGWASDGERDDQMGSGERHIAYLRPGAAMGSAAQ